MTDLAEAWHELARYFTWRDGLDVAILSLVCFRIYLWIRGTVAVHVAVGLLLVGAGAFAAQRAGLVLTTYLLRAASALGVLLVFFLFRREIRRGLLGASPLRWVQRRWLRRGRADQSPSLRALAEGLVRLAERRIGALVVLPRLDDLEEHIQGGQEIDVALQPALLEAIFQTASPLHDGALILRHGRAVFAGAVLPLAEGDELREELGTRHRAALGLCQATDALVLVVSEERGEISIATRGAMRPAPGRADALASLLGTEVSPGAGRLVPRRAARSKAGVLRKTLSAALALAVITLAALATWGALLGERGTVRTRRVELELRRVPESIQVEVARPRSGAVTVRVRGPAHLLTPEQLAEIRAWVTVGHGAKPGSTWAPVHVDAPRGLSVESTDPRRVLLRIRAKPFLRHPRGVPR